MENVQDEGGETLFHFEMAPDRFTEEMYDFLATLVPGRFQFELGIQSTHERTLEAVNRELTRVKLIEPSAGWQVLAISISMLISFLDPPVKHGKVFRPLLLISLQWVPTISRWAC